MYIEIEGMHNHGKRLYVTSTEAGGYYMVIADGTEQGYKPINKSLYYALLESNQ